MVDDEEPCHDSVETPPPPYGHLLIPESYLCLDKLKELATLMRTLLHVPLMSVLRGSIVYFYAVACGGLPRRSTSHWLNLLADLICQHTRRRLRTAYI